MSGEPLTDAERAELAQLEAELAKPYIPREIVERIYAEIPERMRAGALELAAELAPLARRDPEAFGRVWCERVEQLAGELAERVRAELGRWTAPGRQWVRRQ